MPSFKTEVKGKSFGIKQLYLFCNLALALIILIIGLSPSAVQFLYAQGLYNLTSPLQRLISGIFPFAIGDVLYVLLIFWLFINVLAFIKKHKNIQIAKRTWFVAALLQISNLLVLVYIIFKILWGLNYSRPSIAKQLNINNKLYNVKELLSLGNFMIDKANASKSTLIQQKEQVFNIKDLREEAVKAYKITAKQYPELAYKYPSIKPALSSWLISKMGIEGYYNPLSGEANINMQLPNFVLPYTVCHEIAHQIGVAYEDEANLVGYLAAIKSPNTQFNYAAYYTMLRYILFEIRIKSPNDYKILRKRLKPEILADFKTENEFWRKHNNAMFTYMDATFDKFLKLNNQKNGINSYQNIVLWLHNYYQKERSRQ